MKRLIALGLVCMMVVLGTAVVSATARADEAQASAAGDEQTTAAQESAPEDSGSGLPFSMGTDHAFMSKYIWRGLNVTDDPVWQPDVWVSYKGFTANVWTNMDLTNVNGNDTMFNEIDYTLSYSGEYDKLSYTAGMIHYEFPNTSFPPTSEVYGVLGYDVLLQPTVSLYYDFHKADGVYGTLGLSHSFELPKIVDPVSMSLDLSTHVGFATKNWNNYYYGADHTAFVDYVAGASLPVGIGDHITITPSVAYSTVLDRTLSSKASNEHTMIYGVVISASL